MKLRLLIFYTLYFICINSLANDMHYGLHIRSYPNRQSELSYLLLENGQSFDLNSEIKISFEMYVRNENVFGNVFRIVTNKDETIDFMFTVGENDKRFPIFVINESVYPISQEVIRGKWIPMGLILSPQNDKVTLCYGDIEVPVDYPISKVRNFKMSFGLCPFTGLATADVASVNLRDIQVYKKDKLFRSWKLEKHHEELCFDSVAHVPAITHNPYWLIDDYITWHKIYGTQMVDAPSVAFNPETGEFYMVSDSERVMVYNTNDSQTREIKVKGGLYTANSPNQLLYIPETKSLLSYNINEDLFSFFSFENQTWSNHTVSTTEHSYWNNSVIFNPADSAMISFGGYGYYRYNNELIKKYPFGNKANEKIRLSEISPRYATGTTIVDNTLYIFGGRGSKSGRQELFPQNYYDFYAVNLLTYQVNKLWEASTDGVEFISGENLVYDRENDCFYLFATRSGGTLLRITTKDATFEPMTLSTEADLEAQMLYSNLYYSGKQKKLFALTNKIGVDNSAEISIYAINYPPISVADLSQQIIIETTKSFVWTYILSGALIVLLLIGWYFWKKKKGAKSDGTSGKEQTMSDAEKGQSSLSVPYLQKDEVDIPNSYDFSKSCICLLGGFHVRDKNGEDITGSFTPTLKSLLILLILFTEENSKGILGKKMLQLLWYDKTQESAKNNRNVYLSKLRVVLERIGTVEVVNQSGFWSIKFGDDMICDYNMAMRIYASIKENELKDEALFNQLLELLLRGTLLPNTEMDWIDHFKSDFSNLTIDTLSSLLSEQNNISNSLKLKIADTLFQHDYVNEEALRTKCILLSESGKMGLAKTCYDNFCREYNNLLGVEYKYSLSDIIKG